MKKFVRWMIVAAVVTVILGVTYVSIQQVYRQGANDPQIQLAEDAAVALTKDINPADLVGNKRVDLATSLASYLIIYDNVGKPVASSGYLDNEIPVPPDGVFDYVRFNPQNRITWEPKPGVRQAVVLTKSAGEPSYFVLAGRSLRGVEVRESKLSLQVGLAWVASIILITVLVFV